ncbi:hypothetical protein SAMN06297422_1306 [Lachnospiraceae bacterium]|nr:hypothetical protein SAMN06297422_1306 [Lachnospiraceae bacterium]
MINTAIELIDKMIKDDEQVTIAVLVKRSGFSRSFFNQNTKVREAVEHARAIQEKTDYNYNRKVVLEKALKKENERLATENKALKEENLELNRQMKLLKVKLVEKI